jgi:gliding motility-associated-like protein
MIISGQLTPGVTLSSSANPYCEGKPVTINATGTNGGPVPHYQWILNGSPFGTDTAAYVWIPSPGDSIRCVFTSSLACVTVNPVSSALIILNPDLSHPAGITISASPNPFCAGTMVTFSATPVNGGSNPIYNWRINGKYNGANSSSYTYVPTPNDVVDCQVNSNLDCVSGSPALSASITMIGKSTVSKFTVYPLDTIISFPLITFTDESTGSTNCTIDWGDGTITPCDSIQHSYHATGTFIIKEFVNNDVGCFDSSFAQVVIRPEYSLYIPNAFTPNGDGLNDVFRPVYKGDEKFSMLIFNEIGEQIFSTEDPVTGWDGRYRGELCPEGAYVYKIEFTDRNSPGKKSYKGRVFLLRRK